MNAFGTIAEDLRSNLLAQRGTNLRLGIVYLVQDAYAKRMNCMTEKWLQAQGVTLAELLRTSRRRDFERTVAERVQALKVEIDILTMHIDSRPEGVLQHFGIPSAGNPGWMIWKVRSV